MGFQIERLEGKGMKAKVIDGGEQYTTYETFAKAAGYPESASIKHGSSVNAYEIEGGTVELKARGDHGVEPRKVYVAEYDGHVFLIGEAGLKIIEAPTLGSVTDEQLIEELKKRAYERGYSAGFDDATKDPYQALSDKYFGEADMDRFFKTRDEIVQKAKDDVEELKRPGEFYGTWEYRQNVDGNNGRGSGNAYNAEYVINREKRTVVALLRGYRTNHVMERGVAKCDPSDCFNEYIGKAIALRRALGLDVPSDYLNAPQPEGKQVGDVCLAEDPWGKDKIRTLVSVFSEGPKSEAKVNSPFAKRATVVDDTARYQ